VPGLGYEHLEIGEGGTARATLETLPLHEGTIPVEQRAVLRTQLLRYCERDTLAMVKLLEALSALA